MPDNITKNPKYYYYLLDDWSIQTVGDLIDKPDGILFGKDPQKIFSWKDGVLIQSNLTQILEAHVLNSEATQNLKQMATNTPLLLPLKQGTILAIPISEINTVALEYEGVNHLLTDYKFFKARELANLEKNQDYKKRDFGSGTGHDNLSVRHNQATVWVWSKALSDVKTRKDKNSNGITSIAADVEGYEIEPLMGKWINVTPFIKNLTTSVTSTGGNFSIQLTPIAAEWSNEKNHWDLKRRNTFVYDDKNTKNVLFTDFLDHKHKQEDKSNIYLLHHTIQANDLVVIWYEHLLCEGVDRPKSLEDEFIRDNIDLEDQIIDMIGLVDSSTVQVNGGSSSANVTIQGRDLMKIVLDESTLFYASQYAENKFYLTGGKNSAWANRLFDGSLTQLNLFRQNTVQDVIKYVLKNLSAMKLIPDQVLRNAYKDQLLSFQGDLEPMDTKIGAEIVKNMVDEREFIMLFIGSYRRLKGLDKLNEDVELHEIQTIIADLYIKINKDFDDNKINEGGYINQNDATSLSVDTFDNRLFYAEELLFYKIDYDVFTIVNRIAILKYKEFLYSQEKRELRRNPTDDPKDNKGIWSLINLIIDPAVAELRVVDSNISTISGSLIQYFKKVCMEPFVEFFGDTYGNKYYFTVRKPPFDRLSIITGIDGQFEVEQPYHQRLKEKEIFDPLYPIKSGNNQLELVENRIDPNKKSKFGDTGDVLINIESSDVFEETLSYTQGENYSWYHVRTPATFGGEQAALFMIPPIVFPELIELWGNKPLDVMHNYLPYEHKNYDENNEKARSIELRLFNDLKYIIDTHIYLPFTRRGRLVLQGDRRIKKGNWIRYKRTNELFYVDAVSQSFIMAGDGQQRRTVVEVSRGMVEDYIYGKYIPELDQIVGYFTIANTDLPSDDKLFKKQIIPKTKEVRVFTVFDVNGKPVETYQMDEAKVRKKLGYSPATLIDNSNGTFVDPQKVVFDKSKIEPTTLTPNP